MHRRISYVVRGARRHQGSCIRQGSYPGRLFIITSFNNAFLVADSTAPPSPTTESWPAVIICNHRCARCEQSVKTLLEQSPSSKSLVELWAHILEEERTLQRRFQVRYGTVRYGTVRYGTVRYGTVRYGTVRQEPREGSLPTSTRHVERFPSCSLFCASRHSSMASHNTLSEKDPVGHRNRTPRAACCLGAPGRGGSWGWARTSSTGERRG